MISTLALIFYSHISHGKSVLFEKKEEQTTPKRSVADPKKQTNTGGNLPRYYFAFSRSFGSTRADIVANSAADSILQSIRAGSTVEVNIAHSIIAFAKEFPPVIGTSQNGLKFIGQARLESNSKRIFVDFHTVAKNGRSYKFTGSAISETGDQGLQGTFYSNEGKFFAGQFISSMAAAYFDGLIPNHSNPYGQVIKDNSVDSAFKSGIAAGAMASADRFKEKLSKEPEFSEIKGPLSLKILVLTNPETK